MKWNLTLLAFVYITVSVLHANEGTITPEKYWILFVEKSSYQMYKQDIEAVADGLGIAKRSIKRRMRVMQTHQTIDSYDIPVDDRMIHKLMKIGIEPVAYSRWLNGLSAFIPEDRINIIRDLPFVKAIRKVVISEHQLPKYISYKKEILQQEHHFDYGLSYTQNDLIYVPQVHDLGLSGKNILIGMLDTGFDHTGRQVFSKMDIIAEYDFHWGDTRTANETNDPLSQHRHGTMTLAVIGGFQEGELIGPAYGASFALAKTEWVPTETKIEEDHWIEGIEWLERLGADIVSSSLGYTTFDDSASNYDYNDLNGNTCLTTIAADIAVRKGMVVLNSAGNERNGSWYYIVSPADGDSVIAVGGVQSDGNITSFSSAGPTSDGRIKPDIVAMGSGIYTINPDVEGNFLYSSGTSFACPLAAGVCALILEAHPELKPTDVRDAIRNTADRVEDPDNLYGWGLVNAYDAVFYHGMIFHNFEYLLDPINEVQLISVDILTKDRNFPESINIYIRNDDGDFFNLPMFTSSETFPFRYTVQIPVNINKNEMQFYIEAMDSNGKKHIGPIYAPHELYTFSTSSGSIHVHHEKPNSFSLFQNYPNPFNAQTTIVMDIPSINHVRLSIIDILGREVAVLYNQLSDPGRMRLLWDGKDESGQYVSGGIFFCRMIADDYTATIKMIFIK